MKETTNYGLKKPDGTDFVGPGPFNENADVIDKKLKSIEDEKADKNHNHDSTYYDKTNIDNKFKNENEKIEAISKIATENKEAITKKGNCNARFLQGETIPTASWVATTADYLPPTIATQLMADYPFMADITLAEINETWKADILPDLKGQEILAPVNVTSSGIVRIYAKEKPAEDISILNLELRKAVV